MGDKYSSLIVAKYGKGNFVYTGLVGVNLMSSNHQSTISFRHLTIILLLFQQYKYRSKKVDINFFYLK
jgi:hypothetical protein